MKLPAQEVLPIAMEVLERGQHARLTVAGSSMLPFLREGDTVELAPVRSRPSLGDIVLAQPEPGRWVIHRIVEVRGGRFRLRGDNQTSDDGPHPMSRAVGLVVSVIRNGRAVSFDCGWRKTTALLWMRLNPLGPALLEALLPLRRTVARLRHRKR